MRRNNKVSLKPVLFLLGELAKACVSAECHALMLRPGPGELKFFSFQMSILQETRLSLREIEPFVLVLHLMEIYISGT